MNPNKLYSSIAKSYDLIFRLSGYTLAIKHFINRLPYDRTAPLRVLDAGCGTGLYSFAILNRFPDSNVVAFDLNEDMIAKFRARLAENGEQRKRVEVFTANIIEPLSLAGRRFDLIITGGVLEYVDIEKAAKNLSAHLDNGGHFLNVSVQDNIFGKIVGMMYGLEPNSTEENIRAFTGNGLTLVKDMSFPLTRKAYLFKKP